MNNLIKPFALGLILISTFHVHANEIPEFTIMTEDWRPYQYIEEGELKGLTVDLMELLLKEVGSHQNRDDIQLVPWSRGYYTLENHENTILFLTARIEERESSFKWVGSVFTSYIYFIAKKSQNIQINSKDELNNYLIGVLYDDVSEFLVTRLGVSSDNMHRSNDDNSNTKMLDLDRLDMIVSGWDAFVEDAEDAEINADLFEPVYIVDQTSFYYAFHKSTEDSIIEKFQDALDEIKRRGDLDKLFEEYGLSQEVSLIDHH